LQIQLFWTDPNTGEARQPSLETPVAIGREFSQMPSEINGKRVARMVIKDDLIADYHALIDWQNQELTIVNQSSNSSSLKINNIETPSSSLNNSDRIQIGECEIVVNFTVPTATTTDVWECDRMVGFLFKRRCGRTDRTNCPDCNQTDDPYYYDYEYYSGYGNYRSGRWGNNYYNERDRYCYDPESGNVDFTEADSICLENERDGDFETNMGAS
jgi:FHA domain